MNETVSTLLVILVAAPASGALLVAGIRLGRRLRLARLARVAHAARQEPAHTPVPHIGADETDFPRELRALRGAEVSPELVSDIETELRWGLIWHDFEAALQAEVDRIFAPAIDQLTSCRSFQELRDLLHLHVELVTA